MFCLCSDNFVDLRNAAMLFIRIKYNFSLLKPGTYLLIFDSYDNIIPCWEWCDNAKSHSHTVRQF